MLTILSYTMIICFMYLVMSRRLSPLVALMLVPVVFACIGGFAAGLGPMMIDGVKMLAPTGIMLTFAILYFSMMTDAGLFNPLVKVILKVVQGDPQKIVIGSAILGICVGLDGDGATTYIITTAALLPLYRRTGIRLQVMATVLLLSNGVMNMLPWAGPFSRAASAMHVDVADLFMEMLPMMLAALAWVVFVAFLLGRMEKRRLGVIELREGEGMDHFQESAPGDWRFAFNAVLTIALIACMVMSVLPLPILFMLAFGIGAVVNFPKIEDQKALISRHAGNVMLVSLLIFAAGIFVGIMTGTGMIKAISESLIYVIPQWAGQYMSLITAFISMPGTYVLTNDAFYFGILPILADTASHYGIGPMEMAVAGLIGQPVHVLSPLVASTYLLCGLLDVDYANNQRISFKWSVGTVGVMFVMSLLIGALSILH
ncbi:CitMHS family transporter [Pseudomonas sp. Irchel 3A5]|uniref:CitMHS family transporter n=1 Tax=Pseudomonas sp. Irchel 3A5 TaxID=2008911 RepID=UPI000BA4D04F|nr:citrate:proton symporter [Pseudomonas sp. Irchel 3A5]